MLLEPKADDEAGSYGFSQGVSSPSTAINLVHLPSEQTAGSNDAK